MKEEDYGFDIIEKKENSIVLGVRPEKLREYLLKDVKQENRDIATGTSVSWKSELTKTPVKITNPQTAIKLVRKAIMEDTLSRRIIEVMAQFASTKVRLIGAHKYKKFFRNWMTKLRIENGIRKQMFYHYFLDGNVVALKQTKPINLKKIKKADLEKNNDFFDLIDSKYEVAMQDIRYSKKFTSILNDIVKKNKDSFKDDFYFTYRMAYDTSAKKLRWTNKTLPVGYSLLNVENIILKGSPEFGLLQMFYTPTAELIEIINKSINKKMYRFNAIIKTLPLYFVSQIAAMNDNTVIKMSSFRDSLINTGIEIFPEDVRMITRMKSSFDKFAYPILTNALPFIDKKKKLMESDDILLENIIKKILLIKVGNDEFPAKATHIRAMNNLIKKQGNVWKLVWNHAVSIEWIETNIESLLNNERYKPFNDEIRQAAGIVSVLTGVGGDKETTGEGLISLRGLIENIADAQEEIDEWLYKEFEDIGEVMQFDNVPKPQSNIFSLEDKVSMAKIYTALVDRGILSRHMVASVFGEDWENEMLPDIEKEKKYVDKGIIPVQGSPYHQAGSSNENNNNNDDVVANEKKGSQGRPVETIGEYPKDRKKAPVKGANNVASRKKEETNTYDVLGSKKKKYVEIKEKKGNDELFLFSVE